jgi:hypothetical protein
MKMGTFIFHVRDRSRYQLALLFGECTLNLIGNIDCDADADTEASHASRLGRHRHSRESGNPEAGQPSRHCKIMKMGRSITGKNHRAAELIFARDTNRFFN